MGEIGTGHGYFPRRPIADRRPLVWPGGARAAFAVLVSTEYCEMQPPADAFVPPTVPGGFGRGPYPDLRVWSTRAYGNRIGIFRVLDALAGAAMPGTVAIDALTVAHCPQLVDHLREREVEIAAHGMSATRVISAHMTEAEERCYIGDALHVLERAFGRRPSGWHGPEYGESARTPALLAEFGLDYVLDWPNDEQPYRMTTAAGPLVSVPVALDLDDVFAHHQRRVPMARWRQAVGEALDRLLDDGAVAGRLLVLNIHPWLTGHPFRIGYLEDVLADAAARPGLWRATAGEIAAYWKANCDES